MTAAKKKFIMAFKSSFLRPSVVPDNNLRSEGSREMSKFLKFIVHFVVICAIIIALGLTIPPFFGVETFIVSDTSQNTNLPMGSVTYAIPVKTEEIRENDPILVKEDDNTYRYNVKRIDLSTHTGAVVDPSVTDGKEITVAVPDYCKKVVITIGYVGYLLIATKSTEGLIILGLVLLFLIILYIIAELWKKDDRDYDDVDEDPAPGYIKSAKELKREEKARAKRMKEEEKEIAQENKKGRKAKKAEKKKVRTGGFVDEIDDEDEEEETVAVRNDSAPIQPEVGEAHEILRQGIAAATADSNSIQQEVLRMMNSDDQKQNEPQQPQQAASEIQEQTRQAVGMPPVDEVPVRKRAIPGYSPEELAGIIGKATFTIGMRLHTLIFSAKMGVPFVGIEYDPKVKYYVDMLDMHLAGTAEGFDYISAFNISSAVLDDIGTYRRHLEKKSEELTTLAEKNTEYLIELMNKPKGKPKKKK